MSRTPKTDKLKDSLAEATYKDEALALFFFARELELELEEQVLCNGKGAERESDLLGKVERLERENARLRMELDASCNAEELRQVRAENARLERELFRATRALADGYIIGACLSESWVDIRVDAVPHGFRIGELVRVILPNA